ncbi:hypothetical protein BJ508DRAFT_314359 [Ascobolus immersus RN42]|uniref:Transcription initiation factor IIA subunit 2 n=1 Tax=Ascobolus immersus RN42 TaxID=1160509 RepID=A0A3N4HL48_ASCIM|nr:hypothetical protein BJ508DRAFT_314359 [Ascobolus immersus RN42]
MEPEFHARKGKERPPRAYDSTSDIFRQTSIGMALIDTLDDWISSGRMTPELANRILYNYDVASKQGIDDAKVNSKNARLTGYMENYKCLDGNWSLKVSKVNVVVPAEDKEIRGNRCLKVLAFASASGDSGLVRRKVDREIY